MDLRSRVERLSLSEVFLPLLFFSGEKIFYAAIIIPLAAGITLTIFELLRSQPRATLSSFYLLWLAVCGALGWIFVGLPAYWIWSLVLLVPETIWAPSDMQRAKPFLFGLKKYFKRRFFELTAALLFAAVFAGLAALLQQKFQGVLSWVLAALALVFFEFLFTVLQGRKK